jgi:hypothetical protein
MCGSTSRLRVGDDCGIVTSGIGVSEASNVRTRSGLSSAYVASRSRKSPVTLLTVFSTDDKSIISGACLGVRRVGNSDSFVSLSEYASSIGGSDSGVSALIRSVRRGFVEVRN